jgi:hypothetical protein
MSKTLVILLSETRAHELTFSNFKQNVIDELNADLCVCIGVTPDYDYTNPYYQLAKHRFLYNEPEDFGDAFDYAYNILSQKKTKYECLRGVNAVFGKLKTPFSITENITPYGDMKHEIKLEDLEDFEEDEIVVHSKTFPDDVWKSKMYGIKKSENHFVCQEHVNTYKKPLHWREFLKIKNQFLGGIKDDQNAHPGSAGILIFFRWFLWKNLIENDLIRQYDRFIITRSDFIYQLPHPKVELMSANRIWFPDCEYYQGYTDRHVILSKTNIESYLNILNNFVNRSNEYFLKMKDKQDWNLEQVIKFHLLQNGVLYLVKEFPYIMYSVRNHNGSTRWASGNYSNDHGYYIKYQSEYDKSTDYKNKFANGIDIYKHVYDIDPKKKGCF